METKPFLLLLALLTAINVFGQIDECNSSSLTMSVMDTCIYYDLSVDAAPIRIQLNNSFGSPCSLVGFRRFISIDPFSCDEYTVEDYRMGKRPNGLVYFIEDDNGKILQGDYVMSDYIDDGNVKHRYLDTLSLRLKSSDFEHSDNRMIECSQGDSVFNAYVVFTFNYNLRPGHYKLFLAYSYNGKDSAHYNVWPSRLFVGSMISNKIDLVVEDPPCKFWSIFKRK